MDIPESCKGCIWCGQCGDDCPDPCEDYSPIEEADMDRSHYRRVLLENADMYQEMIFDYADGNRQEDVTWQR